MRSLLCDLLSPRSSRRLLLLWRLSSRALSVSSIGVGCLRMALPCLLWRLGLLISVLRSAPSSLLLALSLVLARCGVRRATTGRLPGLGVLLMLSVRALWVVLSHKYSTRVMDSALGGPQPTPGQRSRRISA